jgi:hypothetical protein
MRIVFCDIAWMKYYKGKSDNDMPVSDEALQEDDEHALDSNLFKVIHTISSESLEEGTYCFGAIEKRYNTNENNEKFRHQLHIENIYGSQTLVENDRVEDVLVIWCAKEEHGTTTVVGWYKQATLFRDFQTFEYVNDNGIKEKRYYNVFGKSENCVLMPTGPRHRQIWNVPRSKKQGRTFGFGQSQIWYANEESSDEYERDYVKRIIMQIEEYDGENWTDK